MKLTLLTNCTSNLNIRDVMLLFYWYAICYIHLIGKFESEVPKG